MTGKATEELARMEFDGFKSLATISGAAVVAVLATQRLLPDRLPQPDPAMDNITIPASEYSIVGVTLLFTLLSLAASVLFSVGGMYLVTARLRAWSYSNFHND